MSEQKLGRYRLLNLIASGGMGEVFLARQEGPAGFSKLVVVKRILRHLAQDQGFIDQFLNEARLAALLQHPHIAQTFGLEHEEDTWFMALEYVKGKSLRAVIDQAKRKQLKVPPRLAIRLISQVLQGLEYAHALTDEDGGPLGILHRDVSPENVMVASSGVAKLVDFGIARAIGADTRVGRPKGKLIYLAPELVESGPPIDCRSDVYSATVCLYEALVGEPPGHVPRTLGDLHADRRPFVRGPEIPEALNDILERGMALHPDQRFVSAAAMSQVLEDYLVATRQQVQPGDVAEFLVELFGRQSASNPAVPTVDSPRSHTDVVPAVRLPGTAPLSVPLPSQRARTGPIPVEVPAGATAQRRFTRQQTLVAIIFGGGTAAIFLFFTLVAIFSSSGPAVIAEKTPDAGAVRLMPTLVLTPPDPPPRTAPPPRVDPPPQVAPPPELAPDPPPRVAIKRPPPRPRTGHVEVRVKPWAEVIYGGKVLGVTPLSRPVVVTAGTATFILRNKDLKVTRKVSIKVPAGKTVVLKADLLAGR